MKNRKPSMAGTIRLIRQEIINNHNPTSYRLVDSIMGDLSDAFNDDELQPLAEALIIGLFDFSSVSFLESSFPLDGEQILSSVLSSFASHSSIDFTASPYSLQGLPRELSESLLLVPLVGVNIARIKLASDSGELPFFLVWNNISNQSTDVSLLLINSETNQLFYLPTSGKLIGSRGFTSIYIAFLSSISPSHWTDSSSRNKWLNELPVAKSLSHSPHKYIVNHFGHYVLNDVSHLSRLDDLGLAKIFARLYRVGPHDYFDKADQCRLFNPALKTRFFFVNRFEDARRISAESNECLISSKGARLSVQISDNLRQSFCSERLESGSMHCVDPLRVCVGVRGGSREAVNLVEVVIGAIDMVIKSTKMPVHLIVDGLAQSSQNDKSTTRHLSLEKELSIADRFAALVASRPLLHLTSVINLRLVDQLRQIISCKVAISHWGSSELKYSALAGCPTIVHGKRKPYVSRRHYSSGMPTCIFFGPEYIKRYIDGPDGHRECYELDSDKLISKLAEAILETSSLPGATEV